MDEVNLATPRDAFRVQVAAVVAQQAALSEQEIRLVEAHERWQEERDWIVAEADQLTRELADRVEILAMREIHLHSREATMLRLAELFDRLHVQAERQFEMLGRNRQLLIEALDDLAHAETQFRDFLGELARIRSVLDSRPGPFLARAA